MIETREITVHDFIVVLNHVSNDYRLFGRGFADVHQVEEQVDEQLGWDQYKILVHAKDVNEHD